MVWHVHYKDNKYAIWSTIIDDYITPWTTRHEIYRMYRERAIIRATETAKENIERAREEGCSADYYFKCREIKND